MNPRQQKKEAVQASLRGPWRIRTAVRGFADR